MTPAVLKPCITLDLLNQIDIRVGTIQAVTDVANSDKLVQLRVILAIMSARLLLG